MELTDSVRGNELICAVRIDVYLRERGVDGNDSTTVLDSRFQPRLEHGESTLALEIRHDTWQAREVFVHVLQHRCERKGSIIVQR